VLAEEMGTISDRSRQRTPRLMAIGTVCRSVQRLFGVGGETVIVPLLVLWLGYGEREATGTSLAAIVFIAAFCHRGPGRVWQPAFPRRAVDRRARGRRGDDRQWLQQRLATRSITLLFAAVLVAAAVELLLE